MIIAADALGSRQLSGRSDEVRQEEAFRGDSPIEGRARLVSRPFVKPERAMIKALLFSCKSGLVVPVPEPAVSGPGFCLVPAPFRK